MVVGVAVGSAFGANCTDWVTNHACECDYMYTGVKVNALVI